MSNHRIRLFDCSGKSWRLMKDIEAREVGWSIIDTDYSRDGKFLIYSSWSDYVHLCNIYGNEEIHEALHFHPEKSRNFCMFSIQFSPDCKQILAGCSDECLYIYDIERKRRILRVDAHENDINTVTFADDASDIIFSGSDDCLCKVWDKRLLGQQQSPVGVFVGHAEGITHIASKEDGRYLISNSKDQTIKLWDVRKMCDPNTAFNALPRTRRQWDYRWEFHPKNVNKLRSTNDYSIMTYSGHKVLQTLIRCYFSPSFTTGQKYIYSGSQDGIVYLWDVLTGELISQLKGHYGTVRDVSWHPTEPTIISSSWDGLVNMWSYY